MIKILTKKVFKETEDKLEKTLKQNAELLQEIDSLKGILKNAQNELETKSKVFKEEKEDLSLQLGIKIEECNDLAIKLYTTEAELHSNMDTIDDLKGKITELVEENTLLKTREESKPVIEGKYSKDPEKLKEFHETVMPSGELKEKATPYEPNDTKMAIRKTIDEIDDNTKYPKKKRKQKSNKK